jgi:hypothetical protein
MSEFIINIYIIYLNKKVVRFNNRKIPKIKNRLQAKPVYGGCG